MRFVALCVGLLASATNVVVTEAKKKGSNIKYDQPDYGIFEWIHNQKDGYFNPKQEYRRENPDDPNSHYGVFAKEQIDKGETLLKVPWDALIRSENIEEEGQMCCGTVKSLAKELKLGAESKYGPYIEFLNAQPVGELPSAWSEAGQYLLRNITGGNIIETELPPNEPTEWLTHDLALCKHHLDPKDPINQKAALLVVQRSDDALVIPGYDMYNHRNGRHHNTVSNTARFHSQETTASRVIEAGEQIYNSYNRCAECAGRQQGYGTAEILRDYGFIEDYPQTWHFGEHEWEFDLRKEKSGELKVKWRVAPKEDDVEGAIPYFRRQIRRLQRLKNLEYPTNRFNIPQSEWDTCWEFQHAYIVAMTTAIQKLKIRHAELKGLKDLMCTPHQQEGCTTRETKITDDLNTSKPHYDPLEKEFDDLDYVKPSCDNKEIMQFRNTKPIEAVRTHYQMMTFGLDTTNNDICMDLDDIVQICNCYRPQYHEYVVHAAARFVDDVKRVIFIGGGDSMLLHEALKYPNVEKIVGLELDQLVVRKSFIHFQTQPHFDDDRVEWWFGDATKSLLLLPEDYWGSFDLVLVDLSETAMSLTVTKELDVFGALALLLHDDGVMVKNEVYMEHFSDVFDYTLEIYYESPIICSQVVAMGSNKVDFISHQPKDHKVETLLYEPMVTDENHLDLLHHYRQNDAREQGKCGDLPKPDDGDEQGRSAGIMEIVDAEQTNISLDKKIVDKIVKIIKKEGFELATPPTFDAGTGIVEMKEGYIVARTFPDKKYCAFDINLWGRFHKLKDLSKALVDMVGAKRVSSYRVVVGGMYGSSTWKEDRKMVGPQIMQKRNCEEPKGEGKSVGKEVMLKAAFEEGLALLQSSDSIAIVLCDTEENCDAAKMVKANSKIDETIILTCPPLLVEGDEDQTTQNMYTCEKTMAAKLHEVLDGVKVDLIAVDSKATYEFLKVWNSLLSSPGTLSKFVEIDNIMIAADPDPAGEPFRQNFLDRHRKLMEEDPIAHGKFKLQSGSDTVFLGVVCSEDDKFQYHFEAVQKRLAEVFAKKNVKVEIVSIQSGMYKHNDNFHPRNFEAKDYNNVPGLEQFKEQESLGRQAIYQLEPEVEGSPPVLTLVKINEALRKSIKEIEFEATSKHTLSDLGEGAVLVYICKTGSAIAVWDGRTHIDINFYNALDTEKPELAQRFLDSVLEQLDNAFKAALRDEMPRGTGRVVNFAHDMFWTGYSQEGPNFEWAKSSEGTNHHMWNGQHPGGPGEEGYGYHQHEDPAAAEL